MADPPATSKAGKPTQDGKSTASAKDTTKTAPAASAASSDAAVKDVSSIDWADGLRRLKVFQSKNKHCNVPADHNDSLLVSWVESQREDYRRIQNGERAFLNADGVRILTRMGFVFQDKPSRRARKKRVSAAASGSASGPATASPAKAKRAKTPVAKKTKAKKAALQKTPKVEAEDSEWDKNFEALLEFKVENGNCNVPHIFPENQELSAFVSKLKRQFQNYLDGKKTTMSSDQVQKILDIGLMEKSKEDQEDGEFIPHEEMEDDEDAEEMDVKEEHTEEEEAEWVPGGEAKTSDKKRGGSRKGKTTAKREEMIEKLWKERYQQLLQFKEKNGHCLVPKDFPENKRLSAWVGRQRMQYKLFLAGKPCRLDVAKVDMLMDAGFVFRAKSAGAKLCAHKRYECFWEARFSELVEFKKKEGHCMVPKVYKPNSGLASWVGRQRGQYKALMEGKPSILTDDRVARLKDIGFVMNTRTSQEFKFLLAGYRYEEGWEQKYKELLEFKKQHGHAVVPKQYPTSPSLASWTCRQRSQYKKRMDGKIHSMTDERLKRLEAAGFCWNARDPAVIRHVLDINLFKDKWDDQFKVLEAFKKDHGHCLVPKIYKKNQTLASWVFRQRQLHKALLEGRPSTLTKERFERLKAVGFVFNTRKTIPDAEFDDEGNVTNAKSAAPASADDEESKEEKKGRNLTVTSKRATRKSKGAELKKEGTVIKDPPESKPEAEDEDLQEAYKAVQSTVPGLEIMGLPDVDAAEVVTPVVEATIKSLEEGIKVTASESVEAALAATTDKKTSKPLLDETTEDEKDEETPKKAQSSKETSETPPTIEKVTEDSTEADSVTTSDSASKSGKKRGGRKLPTRKATPKRESKGTVETKKQKGGKKVEAATKESSDAPSSVAKKSKKSEGKPKEDTQANEAVADTKEEETPRASSQSSKRSKRQSSASTVKASAASGNDKTPPKMKSAKKDSESEASKRTREESSTAESVKKSKVETRAIRTSVRKKRDV